MGDSTIFDWSTTAVSNSTVAGVNIAENCPMSGMNDADRAIMAGVKGALLAVTAGGTANAITVTQAPVPAALVTGMQVWFKASAANTGATTLALNGLTAKNVFKKIAGTAAALIGGEIQSGDVVGVAYDGTQFQIISGIYPRAVMSFSSGAVQTTAGGTNYIGIGLLTNSEVGVFIPCPVAGTVRNLYVKISAAPGGSETQTFTFRKTAADQALTCTVSAAAVVASDTTHTVTVAAGDSIDVKVVSSASANLAFVAASVEIVPS